MRHPKTIDHFSSMNSGPYGRQRGAVGGWCVLHVLGLTFALGQRLAVGQSDVKPLCASGHVVPQLVSPFTSRSPRQPPKLKQTASARTCTMSAGLAPSLRALGSHGFGSFSSARRRAEPVRL